MIAAVEGWCVAGGLELAAWCDLRVASETARFGCLERRWGVPLIDGGTYRLPRIVGLGRALDLILTGREFDVTEAERIGFVNRVVPRRRLRSGRGRARREQMASFPWQRCSTIDDPSTRASASASRTRSRTRTVSAATSSSPRASRAGVANFERRR